MDCVQLRESLKEREDGKGVSQQAHLEICSKCSALVADLEQIAASASELREAAEPSPRVWNAIEIALRQEGLIHPPRPSRSLLPAFGTRWTWARWVAPVAAALLIAAGLYLRPHSTPRETASNVTPTVAVGMETSDAGLNDDDLLEEISQAGPALRDQYVQNLRFVNESIRDAKDDIAANPNDGEARRSLMEAYQQKAMLFELAMDRSLP